MKIKNILNNSALISIDNDGEEIILIGKGISFGKHPGDVIDESKIEKIFKNREGSDDLEKMLRSIPSAYFEASDVIIRYAEKKLKCELDENIYLALPDHIDATMDRYHNQQQLTFGLLDDLKTIYPEVYDVAEWSLDYLNAVFDINLQEDEAGFLAVHFLNALKDGKLLGNAKKVMKVVHVINEVINCQYSDSYCLKGMNYSRFMAHLKYLAIRYINKKQLNENLSVDIQIPQNDRLIIENSLSSIESKIIEDFGNPFSTDEKNYLRLHLARLLNRSNSI